MSIIHYRGVFPRVHPSVFVAEGAHVIGDVEIGKESSVWFNAVIRGDINYIRIGERTNIQDAAVLHVTHETSPLNIESGVTVGHSAVVHAATIKEFSLIGMGAIVLDDATVGPYALVAAGAVVVGGFVIPEGVLAAGIPAKVVRSLTVEERRSLVQSADHYVEYAATYRI